MSILTRRAAAAASALALAATAALVGSAPASALDGPECGDVITVAVDSGAWATQIRYLERELLDRIAELVGVGVVREVRVVVEPRPSDD